VKVNGTALLNATPERVWAALNDPAVLVATIPGCQRLETVGPDRYRMTVTAGVASIKGTYQGDVALADHDPYRAFTLTASGAGAPGTVSADVRVSLDGRDDGTTLLRYDADAVVGGTVGGVGQRVLAGVARRMAGEFFTAVDGHLTGGPAVSEPADAAPAVPATGPAPVSTALTGAAPVSTAPDAAEPAVYTRPGAPVAARNVQVDVRNPLPAALVGAVIALVGVLVGWRIGRRP